MVIVYLVLEPYAIYNDNDYDIEVSTLNVENMGIYKNKEELDKHIENCVEIMLEKYGPKEEHYATEYYEYKRKQFKLEIQDGFIVIPIDVDKLKEIADDKDI